MMRSIARLLSRIRRNNQGLALIEFAFAAPIFVALVVVGLEITNLAIAHLRINQMAMTVADNAGRTETGIDEAQIYEVFAGAALIGEKLDFEDNGRMILSSLEENGLEGSDSGQMIGWQRCWGELDVQSSYGEEGDGANDDSLAEGMGSGTSRIAAAPGTAAMFVEVTYEYQPLIGDSFFDPPTIRFETAFNVRGRLNNAITNTQRLPEMDCD